MNTIHDHIEEQMATAVAGGLSKEEQAEFDRHLASCPECQKLWKEEQMLSRMLNSTLSEKRPAPGFEDRLVRGFRTSTRNKPKSVFDSLYDLVRFLRLHPAGSMVTIALFFLLLAIGTPSFVRYRQRAQASTILNEARQLDAAKDQYALENNKTGTYIPSFQELTPYLKAGSKLATSGGKDSLGNPFVIGDLSSCVTVSGATKKVLRGAYTDDQTGATSSTSPKQAASSQAAEGKVATEGDAEEAKTDTSLLAQAEKETQKNREQEGSKTKKPSEILQQQAAERTETPADTTPTPIVDVRKLIRNATMEFEVASYESSLEKIMKLAAGEKGFVATTNSSRLPNGKVQGQVIVKVLPENLEPLLLKLRNLGELKNQSLTSQDVTEAYFDTQARIRNARLMEERLIKLLDDARGKVTDLLTVEKELSRVREQIEQMQGKIKVYDSLVQFATITITLYEKDLNEAAGFLLKEQASLSVFSPSVEKTFRDARKAAEDLKAQILHSKLDREENGQVSAILSVLVAPEQSDALLERFRALGRASKLNWTNERVAQGGTEPSDSTHVKRDRVEINLAILHDDESRKQVNLVVVTRGVEASLESARSLAKEKDGEILSSNLSTTTEGRATALLVVRIPAKSSTALLESFRAIGRVSQYAVQREDQLGGNNLQDAPILISLTLTDDEPVTQHTALVILTKKVEEQSDLAKQLAVEMKAEVRASNFQHTPDGHEQANFVFRIPARQHKAFIEKLEDLGKVREYSHTRQDRPSEGEKATEAPVEITMTLINQGDMVPDDKGFFATMRRTFSEGAGALLGSIENIGIGLAYIFPWLLAFGLPIAVAVFIRNRRNRLK